jgi:multidrug efflux pump subunit AcrB
MINYKLKPTATNIIALVIIAIALVILFPFVFIWALNTLFPALAIPYTLDTWFAAFLIKAFFDYNVSTKKD